jgi:hypothetical protein
MEHTCTQSDNIKRFDKAIFGNGQPGLQQSVTELLVHTKVLGETIPIIQEQLGQLLTLRAIEEDRKKSWQYKFKTGLAVLSVIVVIVLGFFNLRNTTTAVTAQENTVITDPATLENALREGKNPKFRDGAATKQYEKNYQEGIKDMNK